MRKANHEYPQPRSADDRSPENFRIKRDTFKVGEREIAGVD